VPDWITKIDKALPAIVAGAVLFIAGQLWEMSGNSKDQGKRLQEMAETLQTVCDQLAQKTALDAVQTEQIRHLRRDVDQIKR
jgi:hypothetical protein